jgi:dipeptidyl aminopeptidase/acylaminoacyl peptidase
MRALLALLCLAALARPALAAGRPMTVDDLLAVKGVSDPQISPDGKRVVYVVSEIDRGANKSNSSLWMVPVEGGEATRLTTTPGTNNHPRWSPDGKHVAFVSSRGGSAQVWLLPIEGGEPRQLTTLPIDVAGPVWSPRGDKLIVAAEVYPGLSPDETAAKDKEKESSRSKVRAFDSLMIRHWDRWDEGKRSHLFVVDAKTGEAKDLTPDLKVNTPPAPFGGSSDYAFSPDGQEVAYTAEPQENPAWSTNTDVWVVPVTGGEPRNVTRKNRAADAQPSYSPDGTWLAFVSQARPGFESDCWKLNLLPRNPEGPLQPVAHQLDRPVQSYAWRRPDPDEPDIVRLVLVLDQDAGEPIVSADYTLEKASGAAAKLSGETILPQVRGGVNTSVSTGADRRVVYLHHDAAHPAEVYTSAKADGSDATALTHHNDELIAGLDLPKAESFTFRGADRDMVQGWLIQPPGFDSGKKYPVLLLIHGGPQGAFHDEWHNRWNYQLFAAPGYAVLAINPRGSTGFGQTFTDQISGDWTGRVYEDLMLGLDHALRTYTFLDGDRMAAAGGSYGGFMVNWIAGHSDRFKALISHAGVFDLTSKYGTTEELWFPEWEFGGPPWEKPDLYRKMSPSEAVERFQTPTLVIHGALDFRVPDAQGLGMFTSLQRRGVPSRFVYFPDEGHWILKPANREAWWREVHGWLARYIGDKAG